MLKMTLVLALVLALVTASATDSGHNSQAASISDDNIAATGGAGGNLVPLW